VRQHKLLRVEVPERDAMALREVRNPLPLSQSPHLPPLGPNPNSYLSPNPKAQSPPYVFAETDENRFEFWISHMASLWRGSGVLDGTVRCEERAHWVGHGETQVRQVRLWYVNAGEGGGGGGGAWTGVSRCGRAFGRLNTGFGQPRGCDGLHGESEPS